MDQTTDVLFFEIGRSANIELSKKICLATLLLKGECFKFIVIAHSLYEFLLFYH